MYDSFLRPGKADFVLGGQYGSEAKGSAAASLAHQLALRGAGYDVCTTNASAQAGHTSIHNGKKRIAFHLPTVALIQRQELPAPLAPIVYLNAGCAIDVDVLKEELRDSGLDPLRFHIHPNAAVITDECKEAERRPDSAQTKIASTRKGVGEALSRKVLRSGQIARNHPFLAPFTRNTPDLNRLLQQGKSVCVEVPQGLSLSLNSRFYPHTTSRDCTVEQAMSDAAIHPQFYGASLLVMRTYPIRVGNVVERQNHGSAATVLGPMDNWKDVILGTSGDCYPDQHEISWEELGQPAEITTVTKRIRRVFTFSFLQLEEAMRRTRPATVMITFCNYLRDPYELDLILQSIGKFAAGLDMPLPEVIFEDGPTTADVHSHLPGGA